MTKINHKVVLITGSTSNLGITLIKTLAQHDYVVYAGARNLPEITSISNKIKNIIPIELDIQNPEQCSTAINQIIKEQKTIDVLINTVGITNVGPSLEITDRNFLDVFEINVIGAFRLIRLVTPYMKKNHKGYIINIISLNGMVPLPNFGIYSATKHALHALGLSLRYELFSEGIRVTNILPGAISSKRKKTNVILVHTPFRERFPLFKALMPFTTTKTIAKTILSLLIKQNPPAIKTIGNDAKITILLYRYLPIFIWDYLMKYIWTKQTDNRG